MNVQYNGKVLSSAYFTL